MSAREVNITLTGEETHRLDGTEVEVVNKAPTGLSVLITSEEVFRQISGFRSHNEEVGKTLRSMRELHRDTARRDEGTSATAQCPPRPHGDRHKCPLKLLAKAVLFVHIKTTIS